MQIISKESVELAFVYLKGLAKNTFTISPDDTNIRIFHERTDSTLYACFVALRAVFPPSVRIGMRDWGSREGMGGLPAPCTQASGSISVINSLYIVFFILILSE